MEEQHQPRSQGLSSEGRHSYLFTVSRPSLVSNVESNVLDMTNIRREIERELSMVSQRAGLGGNKQQGRQYFDKLGPLP